MPASKIYVDQQPGSVTIRRSRGYGKSMLHPISGTGENQPKQKSFPTNVTQTTFVQLKTNKDVTTMLLAILVII